MSIVLWPRSSEHGLCPRGPPRSDERGYWLEPRLILATSCKLRDDVDVFQRGRVAFDNFTSGDLL